MAVGADNIWPMPERCMGINRGGSVWRLGFLPLSGRRRRFLLPHFVFLPRLLMPRRDRQPTPDYAFPHLIDISLYQALAAACKECCAPA